MPHSFRNFARCASSFPPTVGLRSRHTLATTLQLARCQTKSGSSRSRLPSWIECRSCSRMTTHASVTPEDPCHRTIQITMVAIYQVDGSSSTTSSKKARTEKWRQSRHPAVLHGTNCSNCSLNRMRILNPCQSRNEFDQCYGRSQSTSRVSTEHSTLHTGSECQPSTIQHTEN